MKTLKLLTLFTLAIFSFNVSAYGSGGGAKACKKPKFTEFNPIHLAVVAAQSEFSFLASKSTSPSSIEVTVKKLAANVTINEINKGYMVTGKFPESLENTFARVSINAKSNSNCFGSDGWMVKIQTQ